MPQTRLKKRALSLSTGGRPWWIKGASLHADFARNRVYGASSMAAAFALTRASAGLADDANSDFRNFAAGAFRQTSKGLRIEETRTNSVSNTFAGFVAGVIGSGGSLWTGAQFVTIGGISLEMIHTGVKRGIRYARCRLFGTAAAAGATLIAFCGSQQVVAASGQTWTSSFYFDRISGTVPANGYYNVVTGRNSGGSFVEGNGSFGQVFTPTTGFARPVPAPFALANASSVFVRNGLNFSWNNGEVVDITFDIGLPQLELGGFATSPIEAPSAPVTRASESVVFGGSINLPPLSSGSMFFEWEDVLGAIGVHRYLFSCVVDANNLIVARISADNKVHFIVVSGGVSQCDLVSTNDVSAGVHKIAVRWGLNDMAMRCSSALGSPANDAVGSMPAGSPTFSLAQYAGGLAPLNGIVRQVATFLTPKTDADLLDMVA